MFDAETLTLAALELRERCGGDDAAFAAAMKRLRAAAGAGPAPEAAELSAADGPDDGEGDDGRALASLYAGVLDALRACGAEDLAEQTLADALEELEGTGWTVLQDAGGAYRAAEDPADEADSEAYEMTLSASGWELASVGRQIGEVWKGPSGRWFTKKPTGRVVPAKDPHAAHREGGALERAASRHAGKPADRAALGAKLERHERPVLPAGEINAHVRGNAKRAAGMFLRHHGPAAASRIEELAETLESALDRVKGDDWRAERARNLARARLRDLSLALKEVTRREGDEQAKNAGDLRPQIVTARPEQTRPADAAAVPDDLHKFLVSPDGSDHQLQGAAKAVQALDGQGGFLLADGPGAGKTRQMLAVAATYARRGKKVLLVAPAGIIKPDWKTNSISGSVGKDGQAMGVSLSLTKGETPLEAGSVHVSTYEQLQKLSEQVDSDTIVIFDEAHGLKNADSARSQHGRALMDRAGGVLYGTATPADAALDLAYLYRTKLFGDEPWARVRKRLNPDAAGPAEATRNTSEIFDKLTDMGVMVKREVSLDGVEARFDHVTLPEGAEEDLASIAEGASTRDRAQVLMRQRFRQEKHKIPAAVSAVSEELAQGRQVVVFVASVTGEGGDEGAGTPALLREALRKAGVPDEHIAELHGGSAGGGKHAVEAFQGGHAKVLITTAQSGGTGHNLDDTEGTRPRTQVVVTAPFSAIDNAQMWGRTHRLTTRSRSRMRYLFADTPVDKWNADLIRGKVETLGAVVAGEVKRQSIPERGGAAGGEGSGGATLSAVTEEGMGWRPYEGPRGGKGWQRGDEVVYGEKPGGHASAGGAPAGGKAPADAKPAPGPYAGAAQSLANAAKRSSVPLMAAAGTQKVKGTGPHGKVLARDVADWLSRYSARQGGALPKEFDARSLDLLSDALVDEALHALGKDGNAVGWYDAKVKEAMGYVYEVYPELRADPGKDAVFKAMLAITSNGISIDENFNHAARLWEHYRDTGRIDLKGKYGPTGPVINKSLRTLQSLTEKHTLAEVREFLQHPFTASELKKAGFKISGELKDTVLRGSAVFGPKIGSFFGNLNGDFSSVTMDRWWMRSFNRLRGTLTATSPGAVRSQARAAADLLGSMGDAEWREVSAGHDRAAVLAAAKAAAESGAVPAKSPLASWAAARHAAYSRSGFKDKTKANKVGKNLDNGLNGLNESPGSGSERKWVRQVVAAAQEKLRSRGVNLTNADFQALLWYYEKDLWAKMGYSVKRAAPADYATAARALLEKKNGRKKQ